jgi:hypothetical protein
MLIILQRIARIPSAVMAVLMCLFIISSTTERCCAHAEKHDTSSQTVAACESTDECACACEQEEAHGNSGSTHTKETSKDCNDCTSCCLCTAALLTGSTYLAVGLIPIPTPRLVPATPTAFTITDAPPVPPPDRS